MKSAVLAGVALFLLGTMLQAEQGMYYQRIADTLFHILLLSEVEDDYPSFIEHGTTELKAALSKPQFDASSQLLAPRLRAGYETTLLGELNQKGFRVYLYRIRFKTGDDILATMSLKNEEVTGIYFK